jgi:putative ABC transport system permease protein
VRALDRKLWRDLWLLRTQALSIAMVIACGIAAFLGAFSNYDSLDAARSRLYEEARFSDLFAAVKRAPQAVAGELAAIDGVAEADVGLTLDATLDIPGVTQPVVGRFVSLPPAGAGLNRLILTQGRLPSPERSDEVVIGAALADVHRLGPGDRIAALMNGRYASLAIVGVGMSPEYVFAARGAGLPDERGFGVLWIDREPLARAYDLEGAFNRVALRLARDAAPEAVIARVDALLAPHGGLGAHGRAEQLSHRALSQEIDQMRVFGAVLPTIFLAVAGFLVNVVVGRLVGTHREQIAALKALGYGNADIGTFYARLIGIITLGGCALGIALGAWFGLLITDLYTRFFRFPWSAFRLDPALVVTATALTLLAAGAGATGALRAAVRLAPAEAMRPPFPAHFRHLPFERTRVVPALPPALAMVVRNMVRHPLRVSLSTVGIASSVAVLLSGTFWQDATDYLLALSFQSAARQDATVVLTEPMDPLVVLDVRRQPGVLAAEPARTAGAVLRAGHRSYRTAVTGLPDDAQMRRLVNLDGSVLPLPESGIALTDRLAERLAIGVGDRVRVEFVEGRRVAAELVVSSLVVEAVGMMAYLPIGTLDRLLADGPRVTEVNVRLAGPDAEAFVAALKAMPRVAGVSLKRSALASFEETQARNILVFTAILTGFAFVIALWVVYNDARISLAERQWELASLRVLGFTKGEVARLLLGELAIVFAFALPLGLFAGRALAWLLIELMKHETFTIPLVIEPGTYAYAAAAVALAGAASALLIRWRIDGLDLVAVLKARE